MVERLAGPRDLTISLLEVIEPPPPPVAEGMVSNVEGMVALWRKEALEHLAKVADRLREKGVRVEQEIEVGQAAATIAAVAAEGRADLIAMATHGRSGLGRLFFGSVAEAVLRTASAPVLLFRAGWE